MLSTKNLVNNYKEVPETWIFEYYCKLKEKLSGQEIVIKSLFNSKDKAPSMCIYTDKNTKRYKYKDFSSGKGGSALDLIQDLFTIPFKYAAVKVVEEYNDYILHNNGGYNIEEFKEHSRYKVTDHTKRKWNTKDQYFWTQFNIGSKLLEKHHVFPLDNYIMSKEDDGDVKTLTISGNYIYGYYNKEGELYKIYQPKNKEKKFIKVKNYIQGSDQLSGKHKCLVITSSLKDLMSLKSLNLSMDIVSPDSENTMIPKETMIRWKKIYPIIIVLFDNDEPGIKAMKKYRDEYNTPLVLLSLSKDPADSVKDHGALKVRDNLVPLIDAKLCEL